MTNPILPPTEPSVLCRCCRSELHLDGSGFCRDCAARRVEVGALRDGVGWSWCLVVFDDRALPFLLSAWVWSPDRAARRFSCLDLPALEEEGLRLWRTDEQYRHEILETAAELVLEAGRAASVRREGRRHAARG